MSDWSALHSLRIGCVKYLNAKPLIYGYDGPVIFDHPSALARGIARGELDAGLVPIFEALGARHYGVVDKVAIGCDGPVYSVYLAHQVPLERVKTIALDPGSLTSVHLLQVLLAEFYDLRPRCVDIQTFGGPVDAELLIGNQAIDRRLNGAEETQFLDLGQEWKRWTGLPFVFAVWLLHPQVVNPQEIARGFQALQRHGLAHLAEIVSNEMIYDRSLRERYLTQHIRFGLGDREREAIEKFRSLLIKHRFVPEGSQPLKYI